MEKLLISIAIFCLIELQNFSHARQVKPTMPGEPLTPQDFELGKRLKIDKVYANDMTINDGTLNDIIPNTGNRFLRADSDNGGAWPNGVVPYILDDKFSATDRTSIAKGLLFITETTCVKFVPRTTEANYVLVNKESGSNCASVIGMVGGSQPLKLAQRCIDRAGSTAHEFMHALGMHHEQTRMDRDDFIKVLYENIKSGTEGNFNKKHSPEAIMAVKYDEKSITHYSKTAFSTNGEHTLEDKSDPNAKLGQREKLTDLDIQKIKSYYKCNQTATRADMTDEPPSTTSNDTRISGLGIVGAILCQDFDSEKCAYWAAHDYCRKSPVFMPVFCKFTCGLCESGCTDMNKKCPRWAKKKYCNKYSSYMKHFCAKSCKICN